MDFIFDPILQWFQVTFLAILNWFKAFFQWFWDIIYGKLTDGLIYILDSTLTCCSDTITVFTSSIGYLNGSPISYVLGPLNIDYGTQAILAALVCRFILRRIPLIG